MSGIVGLPGSKSGLIGKSGAIGYEEGTWTIATASHNGFGSTINTDGTPRYIKIGDQVTVMAGWYQEGNTSAIAKGDYFAVSGFPFAFSTDSWKSAHFSVGFNYNTSNSALFRAVPNSTTSLFLTVTSLFGSNGNRSGGRIQLVGTYFI